MVLNLSHSESPQCPFFPLPHFSIFTNIANSSLSSVKKIGGVLSSSGFCFWNHKLLPQRAVSPLSQLDSAMPFGPFSLFWRVWPCFPHPFAQWFEMSNETRKVGSSREGNWPFSLLGIICNVFSLAQSLTEQSWAKLHLSQVIEASGIWRVLLCLGVLWKIAFFERIPRRQIAWKYIHPHMLLLPTPACINSTTIHYCRKQVFRKTKIKSSHLPNRTWALTHWRYILSCTVDPWHRN